MSLLIFVIGVSASGLAYAQDEISADGGSVHPGMVLVELPQTLSTGVGAEQILKPYRERRARWGGTFALDYSSYEPVNYEPDFFAGEFGDVYTSPETPMLDLSLTVKRNLSFGSLGVEMAAGFYSNDSDNLLNSDSTLQLIPVRLGAIFFLDTLSPEPYIVPYVSGGGYVMLFSEKQTAGVTKNGTTQVAPYANLGVQFQLDWIDRPHARIAYEDSGIESSFLMLEVRKQMASSAAKDPDFSNEVSFAAGLRVEF